MLAVSSIEALNILEAEGMVLLDKLRENIKTFWSSCGKGLGDVVIFSGFGVDKKQVDNCPIIFMRLLDGGFECREDEEKVLQEIVDMVFFFGNDILLIC